MTRSRIAGILMLLVLAVLANGYWFSLMRPVAVVDAKAGRIACVSYAPYRLAGESPFEPDAKVSAERIDVDLTALAKRFDCVRTYSVGQGLDQVPAIARKHHMKVLLGIWLSRTASDNAKEIALGLKVASEQHDAIRAIVVGNEVLLRGELSPEALVADITQVRQATDLPVTYADVWEFWLKYPQVAPSVSFITMHILPYWEDHPVAISEAVDHVAKIRAQMQAAFPGRELLIGETGWPSAGRQRQAARPSLVNEARFMREFLNWAQANQVAYNVIEAFDQPWKRLLEGTAGGYWGVYDANLHEKFAQQGPVIEEPRAILGLLCGALGALILLLIDLLARRRGAWGASVALLAGAGLGAVVAAQVRELVRSERTGMEWVVGCLLSLFALISALFLARLLTDWYGDTMRPAEPANVASFNWRLPHAALLQSNQLGLVRFVWLFFAAVMNLLFCFDARYRDFPIFLYAAPVMGLFLVALTRKVTLRLGAQERLLSVAVALTALVILLLEQVSNGPAVVWVLLCLFLSGPGVYQMWRERGAPAQ